MITYNTKSSFKPFTVSFDIETEQEAIDFINAVYNLCEINNPVSWNKSKPASIMGLREISDKMVSGDQWVVLLGELKM